MINKDYRKTVYLSLEERKSIADEALRKSGFSFEELKNQSKNRRFETLQAKLSWMVISAYKKQSR